MEGLEGWRQGRRTNEKSRRIVSLEEWRMVWSLGFSWLHCENWCRVGSPSDVGSLKASKDATEACDELRRHPVRPNRESRVVNMSTPTFDIIVCIEEQLQPLCQKKRSR
jgi:hypothetical protein